MESRESELFPFEEFREKQYETVAACLDALDSGYKNIILDGPVGTGKSGICVALLRYADNGWYTTPMKSLRQQIQSDEKLQPHVEDLKARKDYYCSVGNDNCKECPVYNSEEQSCAEQVGPSCNYWRRKQVVMGSDISVITFSMMIIDGLIPTYGSGGMQISFDDRDMLVVDEAHNLIEQTREMHAGFNITPHGIPSHVFKNATSSISYDATMYEDVKGELVDLLNRCDDFIRDISLPQMTDAEKRCYRLTQNIKRANRDVQNDRPWVVDVDGKKYKGDYIKTVDLFPINVSSFLNNFLWSRAGKRIISTATMRHRNNPDIWLRKAGLDPEETKVISVSMTFPPENRPVVKKHMVDSLSNGGCDSNWSSIMENLNKIAEKHSGSKGICHTASYDRAAKIEETANREDGYDFLEDNVYTHTRKEDAEDAVEDWQRSSKDMILSPSMMEGIDLDGDKGVYNVLLKVPYPQINSWTEYLLEETTYGWPSYFDRAAIRVAQAYGRTNRSKNDTSNFYILDEDYEKLKKKTTLPQWLTEAEEYSEISEKTVFDY